MHNDRKSVGEWWGIRNWEGGIGNYYCDRTGWDVRCRYYWFGEIIRKNVYVCLEKLILCVIFGVSVILLFHLKFNVIDMELMEIPEGIPRRKLLVWLTNMALIVYGVGVLFFFDGIEFWLWFVPTITVLVVCSVYIYVWSEGWDILNI